MVMFGFFKKEIHEPMEIQRQDVMNYQEPFRSKILNGEDCDQITGAHGEFGSVNNPIPVNGAMGEIKYLGKLRGKNGSALFFHRVGSTSSSICKYPVDIYQTVCMDGTQWKTLYFDFYHPRRSDLAPLGYSLMHYDKTLRTDIPFAYGVNFPVDNFPHGLPEALIKFYGEETGKVFASHAREKLNKYNFER
jgi:hypothetical protein